MIRRKFLKNTLVSALAFTGLSACNKQGDKKNVNHEKKTPLFSVVHLTDMHLYPGNTVVEEGIKKLLATINSLPQKPDFIINTGDNIMDSLEKTKKETIDQWEFWQEQYRNKLELPLYSCIGNHDVWGWANPNADKNDEFYGKNMAQLYLRMKDRYYSFEHKGIKFICLDSAMFDEKKRGYTAKLDDEQLKWLEETLASTPKEQNIVVFSHIPILSPSVFYDGDNEKSGNWNVPGAWMHIDSRRIKDLFNKYPNVKNAISGHVHLIDQVKYLGVDYYCNGAVCGGWWKGSYQEFGPVMALIEFFDDGTLKNTIINYQDNANS